MDIEKIDLFERLKTYKAFSGLNDSEKIRIINHSTIKPFRKGLVLFYQADKADEVFFILSGRINIIKFRSDESSVILNRLEKGKWLGLAENIADGPYLADAHVVEKSELLCFHKNNFKKLLELPAFCKMVLRTISLDCFSLHANLEINSPLQKIVKYLKAYIDAYGHDNGNMVIEITQDDLAESIGFTRETVNKHLNDLKNKNIISLSRGKIEILKIDYLDRFE